jgi:hypothetical protein
LLMRASFKKNEGKITTAYWVRTFFGLLLAVVVVMVPSSVVCNENRGKEVRSWSRSSRIMVEYLSHVQANDFVEKIMSGN